MTSFQTKKDSIERQEQEFALALSMRVFEKPKMNVWMILIPIIIIFHMYRHHRYVDGRQHFIEHYLFSRQHALDAAAAAVNSNQPVDIPRLAKLSHVPADAAPAFSAWMEALLSHYTDLLTSNGETFGDLVKGAYRNRTNFLLTLNRLNKVEQGFDSAIKPQLEESAQDVDDVIAKIEAHVEALRRSLAERIFP